MTPLLNIAPPSEIPLTEFRHTSLHNPFNLFIDQILHHLQGVPVLLIELFMNIKMFLNILLEDTVFELNEIMLNIHKLIKDKGFLLYIRTNGLQKLFVDEVDPVGLELLH